MSEAALPEYVKPEHGELALQRRWAESRWPAPFLYPNNPNPPTPQPIRVIAPGRWNHGPGPDFRGAQILDADGRARRGDVELHLLPNAWRQHGHHHDPAYDAVLLHLVERLPKRTPPAGVPAALALPSADSTGAHRLPCDGIAARAGGRAVAVRLEQIAERRFARKMRALHALDLPPGPGAEHDRRAVLAVARALGQPHNADQAQRAAANALHAAARWCDLRIQLDPDDAADQPGWRRGRGPLGAPHGVAQALVALLRRWSADGQRPWTSVQELAALPLSDAVDALRIPRLLGRQRAVQLLADAVYPLVGARAAWFRLPAVRYQRSDALRERLGGDLAWRHPHSQALLELEQTRCQQAACRICPLAALDRSASR